MCDWLRIILKCTKGVLQIRTISVLEVLKGAKFGTVLNLDNCYMKYSLGNTIDKELVLEICTSARTELNPWNLKFLYWRHCWYVGLQYRSGFGNAYAKILNLVSCESIRLKIWNLAYGSLWECRVEIWMWFWENVLKGYKKYRMVFDIRIFFIAVELVNVFKFVNTY